jgi:hypothetical protein
MKATLAVLPLLVTVGFANETTIDRAFVQLYNHDFQAAHRIANEHLGSKPDDPLGYGVRASAYLFEELDRLGLLESEFFANDKRIAEKKKLKADPNVKAKFEDAIGALRAKAESRLASKPNDVEAMFAMSLASGLKGDYVALIEKRQFASWSHIKESTEWSLKVLKANPNYTDAYLTAGMTEYIVGSMPFFLRWMVRPDGVEGNKEIGKAKLMKVAESGRYYKPFAKILLALCYVREKKYHETQRLLSDLVAQFPRNPSFRRELDKVTKVIAEKQPASVNADN